MATEVKWTKEQACATINAAVTRLQKDKNAFKVTRSSREVKIETRDINNWITINIDKTFNRIFLVIGDYTGHISWNSMFWKDKELKVAIDRAFALDITMSVDKLTKELHRVFPEIPAQEFENEVLLKK